MEQTVLPHKLTVEERKKLTLTGASEVVRFDEELVELNTSGGMVVVSGQELKLKCLSLDDGAVVIQGKIDGISYAELRKPRGWLR